MSEAVIDKVAEVGNSLADRIGAVLDTIGAKIGQGTEYFWPIFVKQQVIEGISLILLTLLLLCVVALNAFAVYKFNKSAKWNEEGPSNIQAIMVIIFMITGTISLLIGIIFPCVNFEHIATNLFNPEYAAVQSVVDMVSK